MHLVLISLPTHFGQFKVSYNTQKDKWSINELISHCVQKDERLQKDKYESTHLSLTSHNKKKGELRVLSTKETKELCNIYLGYFKYKSMIALNII